MKNERARNSAVNIALVTAIVAAGLYGSIGCNGGETPPSSFDKDYRLIIPQTGAATAPSDIDGLNNDAKWNDAFSLNLIDGSGTPGAVMEGVADADNIYLYFQLDETAFDATDMVAIALSPTSASTDNRLLLIKPCPSGSAGCPGTDDDLPADVVYHVDSDGDGEWESGGGGHGVTAKTATSGGTVWTIEVSIPRAAPFDFPDSKYFGLYANIIETDGFSIATQYTWPFMNDAGDQLIYGTPEDVPVEGIWGNATLNTSIGNGVRISSYDIHTNHGPSTISWDEPNTFYATAHNNTLSSGTLVEAEQVRATFKWANFGLPSHSSFQMIPEDASPATGNPTARSDIQPTGSETYTLDWDAPVDQEDFYRDNPHWCIRVELDSSDGDTVFYRQQAQRNMDFVETGSPFKATAAVSARGMKLPEKAERHQYLLQEKFYNTHPKRRWKSQVQGAEKIREQTYKLAVGQKRAAKLGFSVLPPEVVKPTREVVIKAAGDEGLTGVPVKPGQIVTVLVERPPKRKLSASRMEAGAATRLDEHRAVDQPGTLADTVGDVAPRPGVGGDGPVVDNPEGGDGEGTDKPGTGEKPRSSAVVTASWDKFDNSSFVVPYAVSLKAPKGAKQLYLKLDNANDGVSAREVKVYATEIKDYQLARNPSLALDRNANGIIHLGANLPTVIYRGKRATGRTLTIGEETFNVYQTAGSFGYIVKGEKGK